MPIYHPPEDVPTVDLLPISLAVMGFHDSRRGLPAESSRVPSASKTIIALLVSEGIGTLVIGKNLLWKQEVEMGHVNNQHFVQIPHARSIDMLTYKAQLAGIVVKVQEES